MQIEISYERVDMKDHDFTLVSIGSMLLQTSDDKEQIAH